MPTDTDHIIAWLDNQTADKVERVAAWCRHGWGTLVVKQEAGVIIELNGFKYRNNAKQDRKLIE